MIETAGERRNVADDQPLCKQRDDGFRFPKGTRGQRRRRGQSAHEAADGATAPLLTRRAFLTAALAGAAAAAAGVDPSWAEPLRVSSVPDPGTPGRVVVVGAGLAGLTAALDLEEAGWEVVVLE